MKRVSVIVPCYNEADTIHLLLDALRGQTYPAAQMELVIADGLSTDGTQAAIARWQAAHPELAVKVIENPRRHIPAALNLAIKAAAGEIIVRLDAHSVPHVEYVARCVAGLEAGLGANVGGVWDIRPLADTWVARGIAAAAAHPLGVGGARYRYTNTAAYVDTVPFGSFYKALFEQVGYFDETLLTNEDYELNVRIRQAGGKIWLDPAIRTVYFARATLPALARQYLRYGYWKGQMLRRYPKTLQWRQALPPVFVLGVLGLGALSFFVPAARLLLAVGLALYAAALLAVGGQQALRRRDPGLAAGMPLAMAVMHFCWGGALLWSLLVSSFKKG